MTKFGFYLADIIRKDFEGHRANFAKACGLTPASITNYLVKGDRPTPRTLGQIVNAISNELRKPELVVAYWEDLEAEAGFENIHVRMEIDWLSAIPEFQPDPEEKESKTALSTLERYAKFRPSVRKTLIDLADYLEDKAAS